MGLLDSTQDSTDRALSVMASQPLEPEKPTAKHSAWTVIPRAVAAGVAEAGGNLMDTVGAAGQVVAASGGVTPGFDPADKKQRQQSQEAFDKLKQDGIDWRSDEGKPLYDFARDMRPDPITAGAAENIVFGITKGLTKAVGAGVAMGPTGGAAAFGLSEGMTEAENLAREGVDLETRTQVGTVSGVLNAAGMALPVAGNTLAKTIGLAAVGGPASFVAQQQATRSILDGADYAELAQQYDPLDPVGLTIATLLPAGFGALAMRGAARGARSRVSQEQIDAAMTHNLTTARDAFERTPPDAVDKAMGLETETAPEVRSTEPVIKDPLAQASAEMPTIPTVETPDFTAGRIDQLKTEQPDLMVKLADDAEPMRMEDALAEIKRRAQEGSDDDFGAADAPLLQVAAECALSLGSATP